MSSRLKTPTSQHRDESHMGLWKMLVSCRIAECFLAVIQVKQISACSQGEIALPTK